MKESSFMDSQIAFILRKTEGRTLKEEICQRGHLGAASTTTGARNTMVHAVGDESAQAA